MATIGELDFEVLLKDEDFEKQIQKDIALANGLNISLSNLLDLKKQMGRITQADVLNNRKAQQIAVDNARAQERIKREVEKTNREHEKTIGLKNKLKAQIDVINNGYTSQSRILGELKNLALGYLSIQGASQFLSSLIRVTGEFEMQKTTLSAMLGDMNQAEQVLTRIKGLAVESPFEFKELATYTKQLSAFSVPVEELYDTTKMLADISAGLGVGMDRIILAYGQVRSAAFLRGQEVRQFTEAGIPILDELAKQFSELEGRAVSAGEVFDKISARLVPFEMVAKVFKDMTSEGGKFYNMQEIQAETLQGKISNLKDAYEMMLNEIGEAHSDKLKGGVDTLRKLMLNWENVGSIIASLVVSFGIYKAILASVWAYEKLLAAVEVSVRFAALAKRVNMAAAAFKVFGITSKAATGGILGVLTLLGTLIYKVATTQSTYEKMIKASNDAVSEFNKNVDNETGYLQYLLSRLEKLTVGTREYNEVKGQIQQNYRQYLSAIDEENLKVGNLAGMYDRLSESIIEANRQKALTEGNQAISETFMNSRNSILGNLKKTLDILKIEDRAIRESLSDYVRGSVKYEDLPKEAIAVMEEAARRSQSQGQYGIGYVFRGFNIETLRSQFDAIYRMSQEARDKLAEDLRFMFGPVLPEKETEQELSKFVKTVQDTLGKFGATKENKGIFSSLWAESTTEYYGYLGDIRQRYKEIDQQIKDLGTTQQDNLPALEKQKEAIEAIAKALGVSLTSGGGSGKSPEQIAIESRIDALKKLHDLYKRFKELGAPDDVLAEAFKGYFPDLVKTYGEDFITQQNYLERAIEAARELEKYDKEAGQKILTSLGGDAASKDIEKWTKIYNTIQDASDAAKRYFETLRKWSTEDFTIGGEGVTFDMGKIGSDLRQSLNEIDLREQRARELFNKINSSDETAMATIKEDFEKEFGTGSWDKFYQEFLSKGEQAFKELAEKQKNYEKKLAQESLNDLARKYLKEVYKDDSIDLSEFGDKSLSQVKAMRKKLQDLLAKSPVIIPVEIQNALKNAEGYNEETGSLANVDLTKFLADMGASGVSVSEEEEAMLRLMQVLNALGLSFEKFGETVKGVMADDISEVSQEEAKKTMSAIRSLSSQVASLGETFAKLGEATDNDMLKGFGKGLSSFKEFADILTECESLTGLIADGFSKVTDGTGEAADAAGDMAEEGENIAKSSDWITMIIKVVMLAITKIVDGITGSAEATRQAKEEALEYARALDEIEFEDRMAHFDTIFGTDGFNKYKQSLKEAENYMDKIKDASKEINYNAEDYYNRDTLGMSAFAHLSGSTNKKFKELKDLIDVSGAFTVDKRTGWQKFWGTGSDLIQSYNISDFFDGEGKLMTEKLQAFYDSNKDALDDSTRQSIDDMLAYGEQYEEAMQEINDYVSSIFGQLASDIADSMINSFLEMGDAAGGLEDVFENLGQTMVKSLLESFILDTVLKKYQDKANELYKTSGSLTDQQFWDEMSGLFVDMKDELKGAAPYLNEVFEHLQSIDMMPESGEGEGNSLGEGIKNITEDTANLLASYLNAIRADVSYAKTLWMRMDANTQRIAGLLVGLSVPNLMEYQAQIAANTYDTAVATKSILNELLDVFTYEGGSKAVRVYS